MSVIVAVVSLNSCQLNSDGDKFLWQKKKKKKKTFIKTSKATCPSMFI